MRTNPKLRRTGAYASYVDRTLRINQRLREAWDIGYEVAALRAVHVMKEMVRRGEIRVTAKGHRTGAGVLEEK